MTNRRCVLRGMVVALMVMAGAPTSSFAQTNDPLLVTDSEIPAPDAQDASEQAALRVSPALVENAGEAGTQLVSTITVTNITEAPMMVRASTKALIPNEKVDPEYVSAYDASSWFQIDEPDFLLLAQQQKTVTVKVNLPVGAEPGGHYATVYFESFVPESENVSEATTIINARVGVVVLLIVKGDVHEWATAKPIDTPLIHTETYSSSFDVVLKNDGNVHVLPLGTLIIRDVFGRKVAELSLPLGMVLPGTERHYQLKWNHGLLIGPYTAEGSITSGSQDTTLEPRSATFFVFPVAWILPIVVLVGAVAILVIFRHRRARARTRV